MFGNFIKKMRAHKIITGIVVIVIVVLKKIVILIKTINHAVH